MRRIWLAFLLMAAGARAQTPIPGLETTLSGGVQITLTSFYESLPPLGFAPILVKIQNRSGQTRSWDFQFVNAAGPGDGSRFTLQQTITVEDQTERTVAVLVPLVMAGNLPYYYTTIGIRVSGHGIARGEAQFASPFRSGNPPTPFIAMSRALALRSWGPVEQALADKKSDLRGSAFEPALAPTDWRGWLGVEIVFISEPEWQSLPAAARVALEDWVARGGHLVLCRTTGTIATRSQGLGRVVEARWNGTELAPAEAVSLIMPRDNRYLNNDLAEAYTGAWSLKDRVPARPMNAPLIIGFVVVFAAVVGPLNLYYFAKRERRYRLFWTTPLISIGASVVLAGVIVLQDGFGGWGERLVAVVLLPEQKKEVVMQEQLSRTGVLLSRDFTVTEDLFLTGLALSSSESAVARRLEQTGRTYDGDWFASRSWRGQYLETVRPSRARVELVATDPPAIVSSIGVPLREFRYQDERGLFWGADDVSAGVRTVLQRAPDADMRYLERSYVGEQLRRFGNRPGHFSAVAATDKDVALATLPAIKWKKTTVVFCGPVSKATGEARP